MRERRRVKPCAKCMNRRARVPESCDLGSGRGGGGRSQGEKAGINALTAAMSSCRCPSFTTWLSWQERLRAGKTLIISPPSSSSSFSLLTLFSPFPFFCLLLLLLLFSSAFSFFPYLPLSSCLISSLHTWCSVSLQEMKEAVTHFQCAAGATTYLEVSTIVMVTSAP